MKEKIIDPKLMKNIWIFDRKTDSDQDGVPNYRDCVWYDPKRHKFSRNKAKPSGFRYVIIESGKGDGYCVVADKHKNLRFVFDGTMKQCQKWITEKYKTMVKK